MSLLVTGIGELVTNGPDGDGPLGILHDAALVVEDGVLTWVGARRNAPACDARIDVEG